MGTLHAGSDSDSVTLSGQFIELVKVHLFANSAADNLNLLQNHADTDIASVSYMSNSQGGFTVTLQTSNDLNLQGSGLGAQFLPYQLIYKSIFASDKVIGKALDLPDLIYTDGVGAVLEDRGPQATTVITSPMTLAFKAPPSTALWEPSFTDTLTISIVNK